MVEAAALERLMAAGCTLDELEQALTNATDGARRELSAALRRHAWGGGRSWPEAAIWAPLVVSEKEARRFVDDSPRRKLFNLAMGECCDLYVIDPMTTKQGLDLLWRLLDVRAAVRDVARGLDERTRDDLLQAADSCPVTASSIQMDWGSVRLWLLNLARVAGEVLSRTREPENIVQATTAVANGRTKEPSAGTAEAIVLDLLRSSGQAYVSSEDITFELQKNGFGAIKATAVISRLRHDFHQPIETADRKSDESGYRMKAAT